MYVCMYMRMCIFNVCTWRWDVRVSVESKVEPIGVCERIIIYYTVVDGMSDFFDFFTLTRFSFPKTRYIMCVYKFTFTCYSVFILYSIRGYCRFFILFFPILTQRVMLYGFSIKPCIILFISIIIYYII